MRLLTVLLVALGLLLPQALPSAAAAEASTLTLQAPSSAPRGDLTLTGQYTAATADGAGLTIHLERADGATWVRLESSITDGEGRVAYTTDFTDESVYRLVFDGTAQFDAATSAPATVTVATSVQPARIVISTAGAPVMKSRPATFVARVTSQRQAQRNVAVTFFATMNGEEQVWGTVRTNAKGVARFEQKVGRETLRVGARSEATANLAAANADTLVVEPQSHELQLTWAVPRTVKDEQSAKLRLQVKTVDGQAVRNAVVKLRRNGVRKAVATGRTGPRGNVTFVQTPRFTYSWWVRVQATDLTKAKTSAKRVLRNVAPGSPVRLPGPAPRINLPDQPRAVTAGASVRITTIPDSVWASMQGKSWRAGCAPRSSLRYVRTNYWAFDGYRRQGQLIIAASASGDYRRALESFYRNRVPIRSMYLVDRFGYSSRLNGADDYKSMAADNTSAFNCRDVVGRPGVKSPHATGRSFDINPWENPYAASYGWVPNTYWVERSHPRVAWRSSSHQVVRLLRAAGFSWTYGTRDAHHFDA